MISPVKRYQFTRNIDTMLREHYFNTHRLLLTLILLTLFASYASANAEVTVLEGWCTGESYYVEGSAHLLDSYTWENSVQVLLDREQGDSKVVSVGKFVLPSGHKYLTRVCWTAIAAADVKIIGFSSEGDEAEARDLWVSVKRSPVAVPGGTNDVSHRHVTVTLSVVLEEFGAGGLVPVRVAALGVYATAAGVVGAVLGWLVV